MKKFITYLFIFVSLSTPALIFAGNQLYVRYLTKGVEIISPDGEHTIYDDISKVPEILYASKIIAHGMVILTYDGVDIILKNSQGILVTKNPITRDIEISKVENSKTGPIKLAFDVLTFAEISADGVISLKCGNEKNDDYIVMKILNGNASMQSDGNAFELTRGETFKHTFRGENYAIQIQ